MKICQIIPELGAGGAEKMCADLSIELRKRGHEVIVISLYNKKTSISKSIVENNIPIYYLNKKKGLDTKCIYRLKKLLQRIHPDVIHSHLYAIKYAVASSLFTGIPVIHTVHNIAEKEQDNKDRLLCRLFYKRKLVIPVAISKKIKTTIINYYKLKPNYVPIVFNGINISKFDRKNNYNLHSPCKIIHVGRFQEQKNHMCIVETAKLLKEKNIKFILLGDGELKKEIEGYAKKEKLDYLFDFVGIVDDVNKYLYDSDIFILPSKWEGLPISVLEAMSAGLPIIASDVGGVGDLITTNENGILINPNAIELKNAITVLLCNKDLRQKIGVSAYRDSRLYSVSNMTNSYLKLYSRKKQVNGFI